MEKTEQAVRVLERLLDAKIITAKQAYFSVMSDYPVMENIAYTNTLGTAIRLGDISYEMAFFLTAELSKK